MNLVKDELYQGYVEGTPASGDFFYLNRVDPTSAVVVTRKGGKTTFSDVLVALTSSWKYVAPSSGTVGGWRLVYQVV